MTKTRPKSKTLKASDITPLPPWDKDRPLLRLVEVPLFLKRLYAMPVSAGAVGRWIREGVKGKHGDQIFLVGTTIRRRLFVDKDDLMAFLERM